MKETDLIVQAAADSGACMDCPHKGSDCRENGCKQEEYTEEELDAVG